MERIRLVLVASSCLLLSGCDYRDFDSSERYQSDFHYSYGMASGGRLEVDNFNGPVDIAAWDQAKCDITGVKYASSVSVRDRIKVEVQQTGDTIYVRSVRPAGEIRGNIGVRYTIHVPRRVELSRIVSSNGAIHVEQTDGRADLKTSNGPVRVESMKGPLTVRTSNGGITLEDVDGSISARTSNGPIRAEGVTAGVEAATSNGSITVHFDEKARSVNTPLKFETNNSQIDVTFAAAPHSEIRARTSNGGITLRMPADTSAKVRAGTTHGKVRSDFDAVGGHLTRKAQEFEGTIGSGGPLIDLHTSNGSIQLLKM
jgi:DUF4097 and DUF4098 domain-containing protein YvlB